MKFLSAIDGGRVKDYKEFARIVMPFVRGGRGYFKMNLHPIGFKDTSHGRWLEEFQVSPDLQPNPIVSPGALIADCRKYANGQKTQSRS